MGKKKPRWTTLDHAKRAVETIKKNGQRVSLKTLAEYHNRRPKADQ